jgi:hypothetical protein
MGSTTGAAPIPVGIGKASNELAETVGLVDGALEVDLGDAVAKTLVSAGPAADGATGMRMRGRLPALVSAVVLAAAVAPPGSTGGSILKTKPARPWPVNGAVESEAPAVVG